MNPEHILRDYYPPGSVTYDILVRHGELVAEKSLAIANGLPHLKPDTGFIIEAAMLHDIGIFLTSAPSIGCFGENPYVCHGYLGRQILESIGLSRHGRVAERHTGAGITMKNITALNLPLPMRDMIPETLEEIIICVADKFFSKSPEKQGRTMTVTAIARELEAIDLTHAIRFVSWAEYLGLE